jgi:hypothetical protein
MPISPHHASTALLVSSVPLSLTIMPSLSRRAMSSVHSHTTRCPEIDMSGTAARHSLVTSSTTLSKRNLRPEAIWS